jgi:ABC-type multidrug transport system fused ATPase/permease subunit
LPVVAQIVQDTRDGLERAWDNILEFLPRLGAFLLILIIGYVIAKVLAAVLSRLLHRVGFNRLVERGGVKTALDQSKLDAADILSRIVFWVVFLFVLQLAFGMFGPNPISTLLTGIIAFLPKLFIALVIVVITSAVATAVRDILQSAMGGLTYGRTVAMAAMVLIWFIGLSAALNQVEIAPEIVNGLFYAVLALIVGVAIVSIGGGGIQPMRQRWERALNRAEQEAPRVKQQVQESDTGQMVTSAAGRHEPSALGTEEQPVQPTEPGQPTQQYPPTTGPAT